jgi:hypothetical protein
MFGKSQHVSGSTEGGDSSQIQLEGFIVDVLMAVMAPIIARNKIISFSILPLKSSAKNSKFSKIPACIYIRVSSIKFKLN